jgi:hypothetical protein
MAMAAMSRGSACGCNAKPFPGSISTFMFVQVVVVLKLQKHGHNSIYEGFLKWRYLKIDGF